MLTGDQVGSLFSHYLLSQTDARRQLVGNTIVSSSLLSKIAAAHGARYYQTHTGFKWLTNVAMQEQTEQHQFLFAYEEAYGYTIGSTVLDKDGLSALVAFAQLAAELNAQGKTVWDQLEALYRQHGLHVNAQRSIALAPTRLRWAINCVPRPQRTSQGVKCSSWKILNWHAAPLPMVKP